VLFYARKNLQLGRSIQGEIVLNPEWFIAGQGRCELRVQRPTFYGLFFFPGKETNSFFFPKNFPLREFVFFALSLGCGEDFFPVEKNPVNDGFRFLTAAFLLAIFICITRLGALGAHWVSEAQTLLMTEPFRCPIPSRS